MEPQRTLSLPIISELPPNYRPPSAPTTQVPYNTPIEESPLQKLQDVADRIFAAQQEQYHLTCEILYKVSEMLSDN